MSIDIDQLTEAELVDLNYRIVARLNFLREMRNHHQMLNFSSGLDVGPAASEAPRVPCVEPHKDGDEDRMR